MNFYKGNNILNNKNLSAYLQGMYYDKKGNKTYAEIRNPLQLTNRLLSDIIKIQKRGIILQ